MPARPLPELTRNRRAPEAVLANLLSDSPTTSTEAGLRLLREAGEYGIGVADYLRLAINPQAANDNHAHLRGARDGFEAALAFLNLPTRDSFREGIVLEAAAQTFQTYAGTRALFPEVIDTMLRWDSRQTLFESTDRIVSNSRTITGTELQWTLLKTPDDDTGDEDTFGTWAIPEGGNIPVRSIRSTQSAVRMFKHGGGYEITYEFGRRAALDMLTPFGNRIERQMQASKVKACVATIYFGDGTHAAADTVNQSSLDAGATAGKISRKGLQKWLVNRAKAGAPIDLVIGNFDAYLEWLDLFVLPHLGAGTTQARETAADELRRVGITVGKLPIFDLMVGFALCTSLPAGKLIGITSGETVEELREANSQLAEAEKAIKTQTVTFVRTEVTGYRLTPPADTRQIYDFSA